MMTQHLSRQKLPDNRALIPPTQSRRAPGLLTQYFPFYLGQGPLQFVEQQIIAAMSGYFHAILNTPYTSASAVGKTHMRPLVIAAINAGFLTAVPTNQSVQPAVGLAKRQNCQKIRFCTTLFTPHILTLLSTFVPAVSGLKN
jgi:hypothetical protein